MAQDTSRVQNILIIEPDPSLRWLISRGLQHQGFHVIEASSPLTVPVLDAQQLHLLILDVDNDTQSDWSLLEAAQAHPHFANLPTIVLSWEQSSAEPRQRQQAARVNTNTKTYTQTIYQSKPFDARVLLENVEHLLAESAAQEAVVAARAEEILLAAYSAKTPPSIWPLITAAGILLALIGLMLQITFTVLGILIAVIGLLWWTLGSKPSQRYIM